MKKMEYIAPEEQVVKIELNQIICASGSGEEAPGTGDSEEL